MTSIELLKIMRAENPDAENAKKNKSVRKPYNGISSLYDGEGRGCRIGKDGDLKKVGSVTNMAESRI